jgi:hypothetical protein
VSRRKQVWHGGLEESFALTESGLVLSKQIHQAIEKLVSTALADGFAVREVAHLITHEVYVVESLRVLGARSKQLSRRLESSRSKKIRRK